MWVKICANTSAEDALKAAELGADAVGFVFAPSKRQVTPAQVRPISAELPEHVERVGVFGKLSPEEIAQVVEEARLTAVQLHGGFDRDRSEQLVGLLDAGVQIIEVVHWMVDAGRHAAVAAGALVGILADDAGRRVIVDAKVGDATGGTGVAFDWKSAALVLSPQARLRIILAGGLRPDNVAEAIRILRPWGVDVASGVEREPGRKDYAKLKSFIENARGAI